MHAPLRQSFQVEWRPLAALGPIAPEWHALAERAVEPNVFYTPAFALAAAPVLGPDAGAVLVRTASGRLAGFFPARIARWRGGLDSTLVGWTHPFAPLGTPLVVRDEPEAVIAAWLGHLSRNRAMPPRLLLPFIPERGAFATALNAVLAREDRHNAAFGRHERALLAPGTAREEYIVRSLTASRRKKLRRHRELLEETGPVTFVTSSGATDIEAALQDFLALEASGWKGRAGTAMVSDPAIRNFVQKAVMSLAAGGQVRIDRLRFNGATIAAAITISIGDTAWCWKIAYDERLARSSPGVQMICDLTASLLAGAQPQRVDSCATAGHPMIDHIWRERLALSERLIALRPAVVPFTLACQIEALRRSAVATAKAARNRLRGG